MVTPQFLSLVEAARRLAWPYRKVYDAYLDHRLDGRTDANGHHQVTVVSVNRLLAQTQRDNTDSAA